jgi:antitoxin CptB
MQGIAKGELQWRCRRGMKELDLLLARWLERGWPLADNDRRATFLRLLEEQDPQLAEWLLQGHRPDDPSMLALVDDILSRRI